MGFGLMHKSNITKNLDCYINIRYSQMAAHLDPVCTQIVGM